MLDLVWQEKAACRGELTAVFYLGEFENPEYMNRLRLFCEKCPVLEECQAHAIRWEAFGFWGGQTESERQAHRRRIKVVRRPVRLSYLDDRLQ